MRWIRIAALSALAAAAMAASAMAAPAYQILYETRQPADAKELYLSSYADLAAVYDDDAPLPQPGYLGFGVNEDYQIVGMTHDADAYRVLFQTREPADEKELYLAAYATEADLISGAAVPFGQYAGFPVNEDFQVVGFTHGLDGYQILYQTREPRLGNELYLSTFATLDAFATGDLTGPSGYLDFGVNDDFIVSDFTFDSTGYHVLFQTRRDADEKEVFISTYATLADLFAGDSSEDRYTEIDVRGTEYRVAGFLSLESADPTSAAPEPATWALMLMAFAGAGAALRRQRLAALRA